MPCPGGAAACGRDVQIHDEPGSRDGSGYVITNVLLMSSFQSPARAATCMARTALLRPLSEMAASSPVVEAMFLVLDKQPQWAGRFSAVLSEAPDAVGCVETVCTTPCGRPPRHTNSRRGITFRARQDPRFMSDRHRRHLARSRWTSPARAAGTLIVGLRRRREGERRARPPRRDQQRLRLPDTPC
jgi:hypothetical protein